MNGVDSSGDTALTLAAKSSQSEAVEILLESGARVDIENGKGLTPLMISAYYGNVGIAQLITAPFNASEGFITNWLKTPEGPSKHE